MSIDLSPLATISKVLFNVRLKPIQGQRFQPTGFPDLGAAEYQAAGRDCLLVESAQSMANRLENTVWDEASQDLIPELQGLSYVKVFQNDEYLTSSITEAHRINSPYILEGKDKSFFDQLKEELGGLGDGPINRKLFTEVIFRRDINALIHGLFLAKKELAGGRLRLARALSAFIEAENVHVVSSGGVKNDAVDPSGEASKGFGNVPFSREEYSADQITAYFNLDLAQIRGYGLGENAERLLTLLALFKIRHLLNGNLRLRTACDLEVCDENICAARPQGFVLPSVEALKGDLAQAIAACRDQMIVSSVNYNK